MFTEMNLWKQNPKQHTTEKAHTNQNFKTKLSLFFLVDINV